MEYKSVMKLAFEASNSNYWLTSTEFIDDLLLVKLKMNEFSEPSDGRYNSNSKDVLVGKPGGSLDGNKKIIQAIINSTSTDIKSLVDGLKIEREADTTLGAVWMKAEGILQRATHPNYKQPGVPAELHIALIVYALKEFYKKFNEATRLLKSVAEVENYPYKNYFKLLLLAVMRVKGCPYSLDKDVKLFRGISGPWLEVTEGSTIFLQHFTSTSRDQDKALEYASKLEYRNLLVIEGMGLSGADTMAKMRTEGCPNAICLDHINHNNNKECLIWPCEEFLVTRKFDNEEEKLRTIYLKA